MNRKLFDYILIFIGSICLFYFMLLLMNMSFTTFLLIYPFIALCVFTYAIIELKTKKSILKKIYAPLRYTLITLFAIGLLFFIFIEVLLITKGNEHYTEKSDYIVVLGSQVNGSKISASLKYRLDTALDLHTLHPETTIVVSGGQGPDEDNSEAYFMKEYLMQHGINEKLIIMEDKSRNTLENLRFTKSILDQEQEQYDVTIITNAFHTYRSQLIADNIQLKAHTYAAPMHKISIPNFYFREFFGYCKDWLLSQK